MPANRSSVVARSAALVAAVLATGTIGYRVIEGAGTLDALYMTAITLTTVGYREVFPLGTAGRLFTMLLALGGIGVIFVIATNLARAMLDTDVRRLIGLRRDMGMIKSLNRHIVVCGYGRTGRAVVEVLAEHGAPFAVVELDTQRCRALEDRHAAVVQGDATQEAVLRAAGVDRAATMIMCLADDAHNVYAILLARQLNPRITIIARAVDDGAEERLRLAGADRVLNPYRVGGTRLAITALKPTVVDFVEASLMGSSVELELAEVVVHPSSELAGKTLVGAEVRQRFGVIVVALKRGDRTLFNPGPDERIEAGDVLVALGPIPALERIEQATQ
ncbi:MAG: potassium channel protein [Thermoanaerobaculales bacterium]|jgi:voltage-gated potassium channel|nr:potassium channel protein [Thermoanaerobaculales bacterium]